MLPDEAKTKDQLMNELRTLHQQLARLETLENEHKQVEAALQESQDRYRSLFEQSPVGVGISSLDGKVIDCNKAMETITGYSLDELKNINLAETYVNPADRAPLLETLRQHGKAVNYVVKLKRKDGTPYDALLNLTRVNLGGKDVNQAICVDITERKQAEDREKQLQRELNLSSRLASIGELAAGVAHEINNPLTGIVGFSERLLRKITDEELHRQLRIIYDEALRAARVVENLRTFARRSESGKEYSDINEILARALELRAYQLRTGNIEVETDLAPDLPRAMVNFQQIQQVFLNIILNAEESMTEANNGGKLTVRTRQTRGYIRVSFADDGPGIPAEQLDRVFDPFFTTRGQRGGTGLGLSLCHGIVAEHGGRIYVKSKPGKGATFFVELPLISEEQVGLNEASIGLNQM